MEKIIIQNKEILKTPTENLELFRNLLTSKSVDYESLERQINILIQWLLNAQNNILITGPNAKVIDVAKIIILGLDRLGREQEVNKSNRMSKSLRKKLMRIGSCTACGEGTIGPTSRHGNPLEVHHIVPRNYGGTDTIDNALLVCKNCHTKIH